MSAAQRRQWFQAQLVPDSAAYNVAWALRLRGPLDLVALAAAVDRVVARHAALRTHIRSRDSEVVQCIPEPSGAAVLRVEQVEGETAEVRAGEARRRADMLAAQPFDLSDPDGLFRMRTLVIGSGDHLVVFVVHHIVIDGWSSRIVERDLAEFYRAEVTGTRARMPPESSSYSDYARRQAGADPDLDADIIYWKRHLNGVRPVGLAEDHPRPPKLSLRGARELFTLPLEVFTRIAAFTGARGASPYAGFLAGLAILLHRFSGNDDIVVGTSVLGRPDPDLAETVGLFADSLVLRMAVRSEESVTEIVDRAWDTVRDAYDHGTVPFDLLVRHLRPPRDLSRNPFFQIYLNYLDETITEPVEFPGLRAESVELLTSAAHFDMCFSIVKRPDVVDCAIDYSTDLYTADTIRQYARSFGVLLTGMATDPATAVGRLALLPRDGGNWPVGQGRTARQSGGDIEEET